ncbi:RR1 [Phenacoccus solenopsis nudivirus]|nr:RR1 [Phenacoccus solenopsis nudivirus]
MLIDVKKINGLLKEREEKVKDTNVDRDVVDTFSEFQNSCGPWIKANSRSLIRYLPHIYRWIKHERNGLFTEEGRKLLRDRYCLPGEPIQYCLLRMALLLSKRLDAQQQREASPSSESIAFNTTSAAITSVTATTTTSTKINCLHDTCFCNISSMNGIENSRDNDYYYDTNENNCDEVLHAKFIVDANDNVRKYRDCNTVNKTAYTNDPVYDPRRIATDNYTFFEAADLTDCSIDLPLWKLMYDALSLTYLLLSSNYSNPENVSNVNCSRDLYETEVNTVNLVRNENCVENLASACCMVRLGVDFDAKTLQQLEFVKSTMSRGIGVGLDVSTIPKNSSSCRTRDNNGTIIRNSFSDVVSYLNTNLSLVERKSKCAIYLPMYADTLLEFLEIKNKTALRQIDNVYTAIMMDDLFWELASQPITNTSGSSSSSINYWYLFDTREVYYSETEQLYVERLQFVQEASQQDSVYEYAPDRVVQPTALNEFYTYPKLYKFAYNELVRRGKYSKRLPANELLNKIVSKICSTGSPYVVWANNVNRYSNLKRVGSVTALNLCSEICNYTETVSYCTLATINFGISADSVDESFLKDALHYFGLTEYDIYKNVRLMSSNDIDFRLRSAESRMKMYAYLMGYLACFGLNCHLGRRHNDRQIGINSCGFFDGACLNDYISVVVSDDIVESTSKSEESSSSTMCTVDAATAAPRSESNTTVGNVYLRNNFPFFVSLMSELVYKGAIQASIEVAKRYDIVCKYWNLSEFARGNYQFRLRTNTEFCATNWFDLISAPKPMANSMLTAGAPTATTSKLVGVCESVNLPISASMTVNNSSGIYTFVCKGIRRLCETAPEHAKIYLADDLESQIKGYTHSQSFVDHAQSIKVHIKPTPTELLELLKLTKMYDFKVALYYASFKTIAKPLQIVDKYVKEFQSANSVKDLLKNLPSYNKTSEPTKYRSMFNTDSRLVSTETATISPTFILCHKKNRNGSNDDDDCDACTQ